ncbi:hypothetical protein [Dyadobacter jiangsuensis]|uniref:Uncharacterized protein n=1 Tax=Dyadobacter jiangsuensis TaxID=1591085 RepID=A0A2P8GIB5_9BACT|nr:hypothetical protein [Dyadobacter jiangsuensis]PSL33698.1 hypothetical protein CLV60_10167 [Dyadobacter jiangsuensis]
MCIPFNGVIERFISFLSIATVCSLIISCVPIKQTPKILDEDVPNVNLAYEVQHIEIVDNRKNVSGGEMKIPTISTPKSYTKHSPAITPEHRHEIEAFFKYNIKGAGPSVQAIVILVDAYKEFSATAMSERERGHVRMEVVLYDLATQKQLVSCESLADFGVESMDADQEKMEKIYRYTLRQAVYKCLKSIAASADEE